MKKFIFLCALIAVGLVARPQDTTVVSNSGSPDWEYVISTSNPSGVISLGHMAAFTGSYVSHNGAPTSCWAQTGSGWMGKDFPAALDAVDMVQDSSGALYFLDQAGRVYKDSTSLLVGGIYPIRGIVGFVNSTQDLALYGQGFTPTVGEYAAIRYLHVSGQWGLWFPNLSDRAMTAGHEIISASQHGFVVTADSTTDLHLFVLVESSWVEHALPAMQAELDVRYYATEPMTVADHLWTVITAYDTARNGVLSRSIYACHLDSLAASANWRHIADVKANRFSGPGTFQYLSTGAIDNHYVVMSRMQTGATAEVHIGDTVLSEDQNDLYFFSYGGTVSIAGGTLEAPTGIAAWDSTFFVSGSDYVAKKSFADLGLQQVYPMITTGINDDFAMEVSIYPNPSDGLLKISLGQQVSGFAQVAISDLQGRTLWEGETPSGKIEVNLTGLASGVYIVNVIAGSKRAVEKIVFN